jgi:hypothetical protein
MIHHVFANKSNAGDWLAARAIQSLLPGVSICEHFCDEPFVGRTLRALASARETDLVIIGAGGLLMDYFLPFWEGFRPLADQVPFALWGVGICHRKRVASLPGDVVGEVIAKSRLCYVRDQMTWDHLPGHDLPPPVPCPAFLTAIGPVPARHGLLHVDHYDNVGPGIFEAMESMGQAFASATARAYRRTNNVIKAGNEAALQTTLALYAQSDVVLSSRLHGCILGLGHGCKVVAVSGDRKVESFMAAAGLSDWVIDPEQIADLPRLLEQAENQPGRAAFVQQVQQGNKAIAERVRRLLSALSALEAAEPDAGGARQAEDRLLAERNI